MDLSVYVHIPYCIQRCRYCDFVTFEQQEILPKSEYVQYLLKEIATRSNYVRHKDIRTLYFGGGTPSLLDPSLILAVKRGLANSGFSFRKDLEFTIEINPATINEAQLTELVKIGVNRFSVGAQTFSDRLLSLCGREHSAKDTRETLDLLKKHNLNYSFDLLFALPSQSLDELEKDLKEISMLAPPHLSPYCLTVPEAHPMATNRPDDGKQLEMFDKIRSCMIDLGLQQYEISNFAKPGFESQHNLSYWLDRPYWGLGVSAHSYLPDEGSYGLRFWNPPKLAKYLSQAGEPLGDSGFSGLGRGQHEQLKLSEALTDFCHTALRTTRGLKSELLRRKFGPAGLEAVEDRLAPLIKANLVTPDPEGWSLTTEGQTLSNEVFRQLTYTEADCLAFAKSGGQDLFFDA